VNVVKLNNVIAMNIRAYRKHRKLSQRELAERLKTTRQHISQIETGRKSVSVTMLEKLANKFEIEPYKLLINKKEIQNDKRTIS